MFSVYTPSNPVLRLSQVNDLSCLQNRVETVALSRFLEAYRVVPSHHRCVVPPPPHLKIIWVPQISNKQVCFSVSEALSYFSLTVRRPFPF